MKVAPFICLLALGASLAVSGCNAPASAGATDPAGSVDPRYATTAVGRIDAAGEARNLVASVDGVIAAVDVARGDPVRPGQTLMRIDCGPRIGAEQASLARADEAEALARRVAEGSRVEDVDAAQAQVRAARAARDEAADRLAQAEALVSQGFVSRRELAARRHASEGAEAQLTAAMLAYERLAAGPLGSERAAATASAAAARADARTASALARQCSLQSPVEGEVLQILRREGEHSGASQGTVLVIVGNRAGAIVRAEVAERAAASVRLGQGADVWIEGEPRRWKARITEVANVMGRRSARSLDPTDRFDRDIREVLLQFEGDAPPSIVGLRVMVGFRP